MRSRLKTLISVSIILSTLLITASASSFAETITYTYDELNRLTKMEYGSGTTITYTYDAAGNRLTMSSVTTPTPEPTIVITPTPVPTVTPSPTPQPTPTPEIINDLVTFEPITSTYQTTSDTTGCPPGFVGKFIFDAKITHKGGSPSLSNLVVQVKKLTNGNLLHNADGGHGGVGSTVTILKKDDYSDGILSPGEFVDINFIICLKEKKPFTLLMDVLGVKEAGETNVSQVAESQGTKTESRRVKFRKGSRISGKGFFCRFRP